MCITVRILLEIHMVHCTEVHWYQGSYIELSGGRHLKLSGDRHLKLSGDRQWWKLMLFTDLNIHLTIVHCFQGGIFSRLTD